MWNTYNYEFLMKFPSNIILDWNSDFNNNTSRYWLFSFLLLKKKNSKIFLIKTRSNNLFSKKIKNSTVVYKFISDFFISNAKKKKKYLKKLNKILSSSNCNNFKTSTLWNFFDINFIRKEKIYTKLKYSRVPQYDIVSGGAAALFAGFLGFLICEKFGFELLDSGDFYTAVMYFVFFCFFSRIFLRIFSNYENVWNVLSFKWFFLFYKTIINLIFSIFTNLKLKS
jgi:hypothetical protein